ncbi:MAG: hypothetical protein Q8N62_03700 [Candidatus Omnitrophota bacterium]|nr:hypothetical protein [Candidatus Omnitrophota bacterium]
MSDENCNFETPDIYVAHLASGIDGFVNDYYDRVKSKKITINLQLRYWTEALEKFQVLKGNDFIVEEGVLIINLLANSLSTLAGLNVEGEHYLITLYDKGDWNLKLERSNWYKKLEELNSNYNKLSKHINWERTKLFQEIDYKKISEYMDLTQKIWVWVLNKEYNGNVPSDQLYYFDYTFTYKID